MGIIDITTAQEAKASNYKDQCRLARHWTAFAEKTNGNCKGEFNIFFIDVEIVTASSSNNIVINGFKQITNYWAGPASSIIKAKFRFTQYTEIETFIGVNLESFVVLKSNILRRLLLRFFGLFEPLDSNYYLSNTNHIISEKIKLYWKKTKIFRYTDDSLRIKYHRRSGHLKMKFYRMCSNQNELRNLTMDFKQLVAILNT